MRSPKEKDAVGTNGSDRREFMKKVASLAVYSSPMISLLAGSSQSAWADCPDGSSEGGEIPPTAPGPRSVIDTIVAGVNADTSRQAIQMGFFLSNQCVDGMTLRVWDAAGANPVTIVDLMTEVANNAVGDMVLIASSGFAAIDSPAPDFIMDNLIPVRYLAAGSLTWEWSGIVYWRVCWGGAGYTGSTAVSPENDSDGSVAPPFSGGLPSASLSGLYYEPYDGGGGEAEEATPGYGNSTSSSTDYNFTTGAAVLTNNAGETATLPVTLQMFVVE